MSVLLIMLPLSLITSAGTSISLISSGHLVGHPYHHHQQHTSLSGMQEKRLVALARYRVKRNVSVQVLST
jgi:hypothetical protein